jgi:F-type H+-transporting ATPase subunit b
MQIVSNVALISINETLIIQLLSFLIFLFIINRLMFRPLKDVMSRRESHIGGVKHEIEKAIADLDQATQKIQEEEAAIKKEAFEIRKKLEESGGREAHRIFSAVRGDISELRIKAEEQIQRQVLESKRQVKKESEELAMAMIEKLLDRRFA